MAESAVSFLLNQLSVWLQDERQLLGGLKRDVDYIQGEMRLMRDFLRVADAKEESNPNLKEWVRQVREISYDVHNVLDVYMLRFTHRDTNGFKGCIRNACVPIKDLRARHQIASEIQAIKYRLEDASKSLQRYREMYAAIDQGSSSDLAKNEWYDGRGDALFLEETDVIGLEKPKKELLEWIWSKDNGLEVISVVGMGGLGKTTLVRKVYNDESVKRHFNRQVWIVASDYKDVKHLLTSLIKKLFEGKMKESLPQELENMSADDMRVFIYRFLQQKDYIIVIDDVWDISRWEAIRFALPKQGSHGCIIITTRFTSIGNAACSETNHVYSLEPLTLEESEELFYKKAFPRSPCPPYIKEFAESILMRCEGLPLAIVVIGGLLATKSNIAEEWELFSRSLSHELEGGKLHKLSKLLSLSYYDLPYYLKYCFLYLSLFPDGHLLEKENMIRLWIAEGFVQVKQDKTMEEVAADYLTELLGRNLIQVADRDADGRPRTFRIHDLLREYITSKSREQNIVTIYSGEEMQWPTKMRRLAIHKSINFSIQTIDFKYLRSLVLRFGAMELNQIKELISKCRLLKVLDFGGVPLETIPNEVFKLYHLKHLSLRDTMVKLIPGSIKYLENLETLDLKNSDVTVLPIEILKLRKLRHLLVYTYKESFFTSFDSIQSAKAPCDIGSCLPSLQKLAYIDANEVNGIKIVREVGKLTQLRRLGIAKLRKSDGMELCSSIAKLTNLRSLSIWAVEEDEMLDLDYSLSPSNSSFLRTLMLCGCIEKLPQWVPGLNGLTTLNLAWTRLKEDPLSCLENLPHLAKLGIFHAYFEGLNFKSHGFQKLKELWLGELKCLKWMTMEKGTMPNLKEFGMAGCKLLTNLPQGIEHLDLLQAAYFRNMGEEFEQGVRDLIRSKDKNRCPARLYVV